MTPTSEIIPISVLVRTFNSAKGLGRLLSGIKLGGGDEYIVVDSGSTDSTLAVAAKYGARVVQAPPPFNYSKSLNLGFRAAQNSWVLVISSHTVSMVPDLLETYRTVIRGLPSSVVVAYGINTLNGRGFYDDDKVRIYAEINDTMTEKICTNGNTLYRRSAWEELSFDENVRTGEDRLWMREALKKGYGTCLASSARTMNRSQYPLRYMFNKGYSDSRAFSEGPISIKNLTIGLGSLTKRFLFKGMPLGNLVRYGAHHVGAFFGSRQSRDNTPGR